MLISNPQAELSVAAPQDETLRKCTNRSNQYFVSIGLVESVVVFLFDLVDPELVLLDY